MVMKIRDRGWIDVTGNHNESFTDLLLLTMQNMVIMFPEMICGFQLPDQQYMLITILEYWI